jgi:hypothetical protein
MDLLLQQSWDPVTAAAATAAVVVMRLVKIMKVMKRFQYVHN